MRSETVEVGHPKAGIHQPKIFGPVVVLTMMVAVLGSNGGSTAAAGSFPVWSIALLFVVIAFLGIPHGAVDHLVAARLATDNSAVLRPLRFNLAYLGAMAGYGAVWWVAPGLALGIFLGLAVHHFGQSDLAYLRLPQGQQTVVQWSRGLFVIGAPLLVHVEAVSPVIRDLGGGDPATWSWLAGNGGTWLLVLLGQHVVIGGLIGMRTRNWGAVRREAMSVAVLAALFWRCDPLVGFAVYFGLWHSVAHLLVVMSTLGFTTTQPEPLRVREFARVAAPRTVISILGTAVFAGVAMMNERTELLLPAVFIMVSLLTLPHMVVVERLWRGPSAGLALAKT
jgi:beta-carotene 15,15'-dioxygenase